MADEASMQSFQTGLTYELNRNYGKAMFCYDDATHKDRSNYYAKYRRLMVEHYKNTNSIANDKWVRNEDFLTYAALRKQREHFEVDLGLPQEPLYIKVYLNDDGRLGFVIDDIDVRDLKVMNNWAIGDTISVLQDAMDLISDNSRWEQRYLAIEARRYVPILKHNSKDRIRSEQRANELWEQQKRRHAEWKGQLERKQESVQEGLMEGREKIKTIVIKQSERTGVFEEPISSGLIDIDPSLDKELKNRGWGNRD